MHVLDIGCGPNKYKSANPEDTVTGLDVQKLPCVDVVHDLEKPLPFDDNSFDMVYSRHTIEHIHNLLQLMNEIRRVLVPDGILKLVLPHRSNPFSSYFGHKTYWTSMTFECLDNPEGDLKGFVLVSRRVSLVRPFGFLEPIINRCLRFYEWRLSGLLPAKEVEFVLKRV